MTTDWKVEKQQLEDNLKDTKQQLQEKEEELNVVIAQKVSKPEKNFYCDEIV